MDFTDKNLYTSFHLFLFPSLFHFKYIIIILMIDRVSCFEAFARPHIYPIKKPMRTLSPRKKTFSENFLLQFFPVESILKF